VPEATVCAARGPSPRRARWTCCAETDHAPVSLRGGGRAATRQTLGRPRPRAAQRSAATPPAPWGPCLRASAPALSKSAVLRSGSTRGVSERANERTRRDLRLLHRAAPGARNGRTPLPAIEAKQPPVRAARHRAGKRARARGSEQTEREAQMPPREQTRVRAPRSRAPPPRAQGGAPCLPGG
jgi:hypothetical protein